jgi:hypothetical protein
MAKSSEIREGACRFFFFFERYTGATGMSTKRYSVQSCIAITGRRSSAPEEKELGMLNPLCDESPWRGSS